MIRLYLIGLTILIIAILANGLVMKLGIKSWYGFIELLGSYGLSAFSKINSIDIFWLFFGYPLVLGCGYWLGDKLYQIVL